MGLLLKKITINILLAALSLSGCLLAAEYALSHFTDLGRDDARVSVRRGDIPGDCYTSDARQYFPVILKDPSENRVLHCVFYDVLRRRDGYFPERAKQVALVGDSFTFGQGVKGEDSIGYLLDKRFNAVNFKNFGIPGANIGDVDACVLRILREEKAIKEILYFYNLNDVFVSGEVTNRQKFIFDMQNIRWNNLGKPEGFAAAVFSRSAIIHLVRKIFVLNRESALTVKNYLDMYFDHSNTEQLQTSIDLLTAMNNAAADAGVRFYLIIYPLFYKDTLGRYPFLPVHRLLEKICNSRNIKCIDLYPAFKKYYSLKRFIVNPVDYHPNDLANKIVADYLLKNGDFPFTEQEVGP